LAEEAELREAAADSAVAVRVAAVVSAAAVAVVVDAAVDAGSRYEDFNR
jgi:hypothetical protein